MVITAERNYPADIGSPAEARAFVSQVLDRWGRADLGETACLLASELVTNAVLHAGTMLSVRISLDSQVLRVEIEDWCEDAPQMCEMHLGEHGHGLRIVEALSRSWGSRRQRSGKAVWFDLDATAEAVVLSEPGVAR